MLTPEGRTSDTLSNAGATVFQLLGGDLSAVDIWTRVDFNWMHDGAAIARDVVGYRGLPMSYRVAGLTLGDADAAPSCPPFLIEISPDRLIAQAVWPRDETAYRSQQSEDDPGALQRWAAGSLSKNLCVMRFGDGDLGLEADLHLADSSSVASLREFVTAFSWDVAALHACVDESTLLTTEEWVTRAALSISRSTPAIPLRDHSSPEWHSFESPRGVFCSLQPSGGLCESDNVLYSVRRDAAMLQPLATMPGHRSDWDYARLIDVWLARDGVACFARTLLAKGFVTTSDGQWRAVGTGPVSAIAPWGTDGFLLGLDDGYVEVLDGTQAIALSRRLAQLDGRFSRLVALGDRAIALIGSALVSARVRADVGESMQPDEAWQTPLELTMSFDGVCDLDVDMWSKSPSVAVLGDDGIGLFDAATGAPRGHFTAHEVRQMKWIGPGWLMVMDVIESRAQTRTRIRVLDVVAARWTEPVVTAEVSRLAVRGDEIQVGFANQSIAVWDRLEVCRGIGASTFRTEMIEPSVQTSAPKSKEMKPIDAPVPRVPKV